MTTEKQLTAISTDGGVQYDGRLLRRQPLARTMTHVVLWPRPDGGHLIVAASTSGDRAKRRCEKQNRKIRNPFAGECFVAIVTHV